MTTDWYQNLTTSPIGRTVVGTLGLPAPAELRRHAPGDPILAGPALVGGTAGGTLRAIAEAAVGAVGVDVRPDVEALEQGERFAALVFDASGIGRSQDLGALPDFFGRAQRKLGASGRVVVLGRPPAEAGGWRTAAAQQALDGFIRSTGKEQRDGSTANLVRVGPGAEHGVANALRFVLSGRAAYVSGQVLELHAPPRGELVDPSAEGTQPRSAHAGRVAVVTGAARGIGAAIAEVLARDGAHVVCLDVPAQGEELAAVANAVGGSTLQLDITAEDAPGALAEHLRQRHGGVDVVVHNAGITRDKTLAGMERDAHWDPVVAVNLTSQERLTSALLDGDILREGGRVVCVSSLSGIAGNRGQTAYAASKAGVIGLVRALAHEVAGRRATINAVAPGFIETAMTAAMPFGVREVGRRANSLSQGGRPVDVAEAVAWLAEPASGHVNGQVLRVCGQSLLGA